MSLLEFQLRLFGSLFSKVIGEGRHFDHSSENREIVGR